MINYYANGLIGNAHPPDDNEQHMHAITIIWRIFLCPKINLKMSFLLLSWPL